MRSRAHYLANRPARCGTNGAPGSLAVDRTLSNFISALRNAEVRISTAETLDAFHAVNLVGYEDRGFLKRSLALVLPKTAEEKAIFDQ